MRDKLDCRIKNFLGLGAHLPFFLGKAIIKEHIDMRDRVKGNLLGKDFRLHRIIYKNTFCLVKQLVHRWPPCTRHRLIG